MVKQTPEQLKASDPRSSVWVGASAGTGKTFVLSNRVLRLMLAGSKPDKILCLTYTNTAAAEMAIRVNKRLSQWISMSDNILEVELSEVLGTAATENQMIVARKLFAQVLDVPGGLKIQTIHSFCQSLLGRFPIEANVSPNFDLLDDITINEQLRLSQDQMLQDIDKGGNDQLKEALYYLSGMLAEDTFSTLMKNLTNERGGLEQLFIRNSSSFKNVQKSLKELLGFQKEDSRDSILSAACDDSNFNSDGLYQVSEILLTGTKTDIDRGKLILFWLKNNQKRSESFEDYKRAFLTAKGEFFSKFMTKGLAQKYPDDLDILYHEAQRIKFVNERLKTFTLFENSSAILRLGFELIKIYNNRKRNRNVVDYDDLIGKVRKLFDDVSASWILYKLDGGIDHILIDEAQDTNPEQWLIITKLALEFFSGIGTRDQEKSQQSPRTIFAVGDVKQSIYSFQKAEPEQFNVTRDYFDKQVNAANLDFQNIPMALSFRSTSAILELVDQVFKPEQHRYAISFNYDHIKHDTHRVGAPGLIEIWDPILPQETLEEESWSAPIIQKAIDDPKRILSEKIADQIAEWIKNGEILASKGRPITPGDILILVQKRKEFVHYMIRALKRRKINVAGLDQMVLIKELAVMDLMAVANFTLLPSDNLTLAIVLKSPLIGLSEEDLFDLANPRKKGETLWSALLKRRHERKSFERAADYLTRLTKHSDFHPPFEFFSYLLGPMRGREKLINRLGEQSNDPVDEFLNQAMKYEQNNISSMQGFLSWIVKGNIKIKREMEQGADMVRIMTVHGAKGLQAPIVFLPDTCQSQNMQDNLFWHQGKNQKYMLWVKNEETRLEAGKMAYDKRKNAIESENKRLLYVAMTRAEDRLYVTGWEDKNGRKEDCWYDMMRGALVEMEGVDEITLSDNERILRLERGTYSKPINQDLKTTTKAKPIALADWAFKEPVQEPTPSRPLSPSRPELEDAVVSPLKREQYQKKDKQKYHRGRIIHKLLEILPNIQMEDRKDAALRYLSQKAHDLEPVEIEKIIREVMSILEDENIAVLFGPDSRSEVPIIGQVGSHTLSGQVDRLALSENELLIIDYKTNRPPPKTVAAIPMIYLRQMAGYQAVLQDIYPNLKIRSFLLWTDIGKLMEIPHQTLKKINF